MFGVVQFIARPDAVKRTMNGFLLQTSLPVLKCHIYSMPLIGLLFGSKMVYNLHRKMI